MRGGTVEPSWSKPPVEPCRLTIELTLYLEVEERRESLPRTLQKMSVGRADISMFSFMLISRLEKKIVLLYALQDFLFSQVSRISLRSLGSTLYTVFAL